MLPSREVTCLFRSYQKYKYRENSHPMNEKNLYHDFTVVLTMHGIRDMMGEKVGKGVGLEKVTHKLWD